MVEPGRDPRFTKKPPPNSCVLCAAWMDPLESNRTLEPLIPSPIDSTHSAGAQQILQTVWANIPRKNLSWLTFTACHTSSTRRSMLHRFLA